MPQCDNLYPLHWRHNERDGASNHQPRDCSPKRLSGTDQQKYQSSASLAGHRWIPRPKCHLMTSSCIFSVTPATGSVHIGLSDNEYTSVDESARAEMELCLILKAPITLDTNLNKTCTTGIHGRYIFISLIRGCTDLGNIGLYEVRVYMGKHCRTHR